MINPQTDNTTYVTPGTGHPDWLLDLRDLIWQWNTADSCDFENLLCIPQPREDAAEEALLSGLLMTRWLADVRMTWQAIGNLPDCMA